MIPDYSPLRVLIISNDALARAGLAALLREQPGCEVVGQIPTGEGFPHQRDVFAPDVALLDPGWEGAGLDDLADDALASESCPVVALAAEAAQAGLLWSAGAAGLLSREASGERIAAALWAVSAGLVVVDPAFSEAVLRPAPPDIAAPAEELTPREMEVLRLLVEGLSNRAVAQRLGISEHTVKFHVNAIMTKLGAQSRTDAVVRATRLGLVIL
jgi:DNA-binding NarL/FixJ family response regulator